MKLKLTIEAIGQILYPAIIIGIVSLVEMMLVVLTIRV